MEAIAINCYNRMPDIDIQNTASIFRKVIVFFALYLYNIRLQKMLF